MVTMISQDLSEFELHLRAILGLLIHQVTVDRPHQRSRVILATKTKTPSPNYCGLDAALQVPETEIRIFGKPTTRKWRRMGVALSQGNSLRQDCELGRRKQRAWYAFADQARQD